MPVEGGTFDAEIAGKPARAQPFQPDLVEQGQRRTDNALLVQGLAARQGRRFFNLITHLDISMPANLTAARSCWR